MTGISRLAWRAAGFGGDRSRTCQEPLKAKIGVLRLQSSSPVFIAQDKGYFGEAGLDIELKFFDAAQPIAVATTSATSISASPRSPRACTTSPARAR